MFRIKKIALLAAAAALITAAPAAAEGYLGLEYGSANLDAGSSTDFDVWQGEGAWGFGGEGWGGQIDGQIGNLQSDGDDADFWSLGGHAWWNGTGWRLGGVVTTTQVDVGGSLDEISYGIEGAYDIGANAVLSSSVTTGSIDAGSGSDADTFNWDIGANFYSSPNFRFGGAIGIGSVDASGSDLDTMTYGLNAEFQPWSAPVSITLGYNHFEIEDVSVELNLPTEQACCLPDGSCAYLQGCIFGTPLGCKIFLRQF